VHSDLLTMTKGQTVKSGGQQSPPKNAAATKTETSPAPGRENRERGAIRANLLGSAIFLNGCTDVLGILQNANREIGGPGGRVEQLGRGLFQRDVKIVGEFAVGLPRDVTLRVGDDEVRVVGGGEIDEFLPRGFVVEDGHEMRLFRGGNLLAHAVEDHGPDKARSALEFGNLEIGDTRIAVVVGGNLFALVLTNVAAFVGEAEYEDENLLAVGFGE